MRPTKNSLFRVFREYTNVHFELERVENGEIVCMRFLFFGENRETSVLFSCNDCVISAMFDVTEASISEEFLCGFTMLENFSDDEDFLIHNMFDIKDRMHVFAVDALIEMNNFLKKRVAFSLKNYGYYDFIEELKNEEL